MRSNVSGVGLYNSEYRNFNRGFGRGNSRPFQPSPRQPSPRPQPVRGDIFLEAGRLAVDYLVSHGLLAPNVLSGKCQNGALRNSPVESQDRRNSQEKEIPNSPVDGGSRKSPIDQGAGMLMSYSRERRRLGASKEGASKGTEAEDDKTPKNASKDADTDVSNSQVAEPVSQEERAGELEGNIGNSDSRTTSSLQNKDDEELPKVSDGVTPGCEETKDETSNHGTEKETSIDESATQDCEEKNDTSTKDGMDLLKLCPSSSLNIKSPKNDPLLISEANSNIGDRHDSVDPRKDSTMNDSSGIQSSTEIPSSNCLETGVLDPSYAVDQQKSIEPLSFIDKTCSYAQKDRGEKRALGEGDMVEGLKKAKQWLSVAQSDSYSELSDLSDKQSVSLVKRAEESVNQKSFSNVSLPLRGGIELALEQGQGKQLFSSSFKICDLNLMEASDMHEKHDALLYPSIAAPSKNVGVDIDLSMSNNCSSSNEYNDFGDARKDIEIIDLENPSLQEGKNMNTSTRNMEADITSMESFPNNSQSNNSNPDGQDGYGFMISELLDNDVPNCSSVQPNINSLHNEMGLHHGEGLFSEDDPIYMSLGEIPISLLRVWEQPTQERNPFEL